MDLNGLVMGLITKENFRIGMYSVYTLQIKEGKGEWHQSGPQIQYVNSTAVTFKLSGRSRAVDGAWLVFDMAGNCCVSYFGVLLSLGLCAAEYLAVVAWGTLGPSLLVPVLPWLWTSRHNPLCSCAVGWQMDSD